MDGEFIGRRIRAFRKLKRFSQSELAKRIDVSTSTLARIENGEKEASEELLERILLQLQIELKDLLGK